MLTKPIGAGIAAQAIKTDRIRAEHRIQVIEAMKALNRPGRDAAHLAAGARVLQRTSPAFGLLGHLHHLALGAGCGARLFADSVPLFDGVRAACE